MKRRTFLQHSTAAVGLALIGCKPSTEETGGETGDDTADTGVLSEFQTPLPVPAELTGTLVDGRVVYDLSIQAGTTEFFAGQHADTLGYNGPLLGPTIRARRGDDITLRVTNELDENSTTHWHGAHVPANMDGGPHQLIAPGATWSSEWTVNQVAATIWYHPHAMGSTARQVYFGMGGFFLIDDDASDALDLPNRYGIDDFPIIVQDRRFTADGQLEYTLSMMDQHMGFQGDTILVNGAIKPYLEVEAKQTRLRVLNGSNGRTYTFAFADSTPFQLIGVDNSLLEAPVELTSVRQSPGERVEIVVDFTDRAGEVLIFTDTAGAELFEVRVTGEATATTTVPSTLVALAHHAEQDAVLTRSFILSMVSGNFLINNVSMDMNVINETVPVGQVEIWEITNASSMIHNWHMHAHYFEVLTRNGNPPEAHERGYKDTVILDISDRVRVLVKHEDYTDSTTPYMYHCHILEHEDTGMMGQFVVV